MPALQTPPVLLLPFFLAQARAPREKAPGLFGGAHACAGDVAVNSVHDGDQRDQIGEDQVERGPPPVVERCDERREDDERGVEQGRERAMGDFEDPVLT